MTNAAIIFAMLYPIALCLYVILRPSPKGEHPRRIQDGPMVVARVGQYCVYPDRNLNGSRGTGWHWNVMGKDAFYRGYAFTKMGALCAASSKAALV